METQAKNDGNKPFSWLQPHLLFVVVLVGEEEVPFGIQKDFLCARSSHYREYFSSNDSNELERVVRLPETSAEVFGLAQNFLYTGSVSTGAESTSGYDVLISTWKLGNQLGIDGLCDEVIEAMKECRRVTQSIPATPLLVQAWKDTPENSSIRKLLLNWAAEYIRSSESRSEFSKSLPQEVLSELVVAMSHLNSVPAVQASNSAFAGPWEAKRVHYLDADESEEERAKAARNRHSDVAPGTSRAVSTERKAPAGRKPTARASLPNIKPAKGRRTSLNVNTQEFSNDQKMNFCSDLLTRMLSGPGFWTRLVGPFREPVNPVEDGVPNYLEKVKRPMDLGTIKEKMDRKGYSSCEEFHADVSQIFQNCYEYWNKGDPMWIAGEKFQKSFQEKYSMMNKWIAKMEGQEPT